MKIQSFASVWDAIEDTTEAAAQMKIRSALMMAAKAHIKAKGWTQAEAAQRLGVTEPRISDLMRGKIALFETDALIGLLQSAGMEVEVSVKEAA